MQTGAAEQQLCGDYGYSAGNRNACQMFAEAERGASDFCEAVGKNHIFQAAVPKGETPDGRERSGESDASQLCAVLKRAVPYGFQPAGKSYASQVLAVLKCAFAIPGTLGVVILDRKSVV